MKLKTYEQFINEIADSNASYLFSKTFDEPDSYIEYEFVTDLGTKYVASFTNQINTYNIAVELKNEHPVNVYGFEIEDIYSLTFHIEEASGHGGFNMTSNKGELFKVMATMSKILDSFLKEYSYAIVEFYGSRKANDRDELTKRDKIYLAYLEKWLDRRYVAKTYKTTDIFKDYDGSVKTYTYIFRK